MKGVANLQKTLSQQVQNPLHAILFYQIESFCTHKLRGLVGTLQVKPDADPGLPQNQAPFLGFSLEGRFGQSGPEVAVMLMTLLRNETTLKCLFRSSPLVRRKLNGICGVGSSACQTDRVTP